MLPFSQLARRTSPARNRTLFVRFEQSDANLTRLLVNYTVGGSRAQVQATQVDGVALATLPAAYKTAQFYATRAAPPLFGYSQK